MICELTDYDLDRVEIGMPLEMTFRKLSQGEGIVNYFCMGARGKIDSNAVVMQR